MIGIRFLDGDVTDTIEADALTYNNQHVDIYSCCWGPSDNGGTMREPGKMMGGALEKGAREVMGTSQHRQRDEKGRVTPLVVTRTVSRSTGHGIRVFVLD